MSVQLDQRLRAARPSTHGSPPAFEVVLARIARGDTLAVAAGGYRWLRMAVLIVAVALALAAAAWGAVSVLTGAPVPSAYVDAKPTVGLGQPLHASLGVLPLRASDPAGGPPWAVRLIATTRGLGCIQAGRLVNGQLGVLATDRFAFRGDGKFHPFLASDAIDGACAPIDANGRVVTGGNPQIVTADGLATAGGNVPPGARVHCDMPGEQDWGVRCPQSMLREVAVGFTGPDAVRITVSQPGHADQTIAPYGPDGAYLLVLPPPPNANIGPSGLLGHPPPGMIALTVTFRDGSTCRLPNTSARDACVAKGLVAQPTPSPTAAQAHSRVHASYVRRLTGAPPALAAVGNGFQSTPGGIQQGYGPIVMPRGPGLAITFTARVGTPTLFSDYSVELRRSIVAGCFGGTLLLGRATDSAIRVGQTVRFAIPLQPGCHGTYSGRAYYASTPETFGGGPAGFDLALYPMLPSRGIHVVTVGRFWVNVP